MFCIHENSHSTERVKNCCLERKTDVVSVGIHRKWSRWLSLGVERNVNDEFSVVIGLSYVPREKCNLHLAVT